MDQEVLKATHYTQQLQNALNRGAWAESAPCKAVKGQPMSWAELLRKYKKHSVKHHITAELALQTQSLSVLLLPRKTDVKHVKPEDLDGDSDETIVELRSLSLGNECELQPERVEEGRLGFAALELLNDTPDERESTLLVRAYFAYALKRYKECLALLNPMKFDQDTVSLSTSKASSLTVPSVASQGPGSGGTHLTWTGSIASVDVDAMDLKMWRMVEIIRGRCLQGMAREKLGQEEEALSAYEAAIPLIQNIRVVQLPTSVQPNPSFLRYRELWRWAERLLWRTSCLASKYLPHQRTVDILRLYSTQAQVYPPSFRPNHRATVTALHIHALLLNSPGTNLAPPNQSKLAWITEARTLLEEYRPVLAETTHFPRAGERNVKVEEYSDAVVAVWERSGAKGNEAKWAIEILWWASRMTFHSHRIFRHQIRLLHASGENDLAKRTLKVYAQLVTKSRQASMGEVESTIRRRRTLDGLDNDPAVMDDVEPEAEQGSADSDRQFVDCLIFGARMLCRLPGDVEDAHWAEECLKTATDYVSKNYRLNVDHVLKARVSCADGIVQSTIALREADPTKRLIQMRKAVDHLASAVALNPESADAYYHLAVALLQAGPTRDLDACISAAKHAVELESNEIRYWHLLGLALSAAGQFKQVLDVLAIGEAVEPDEDTVDASVEVPPTDTSPSASGATSSPSGDAANVASEGGIRSESPQGPQTLLSASDSKAPSATSMLLPIPDHPPPSKEDIFEYGLQLRITILAIVELTDGAETASGRWVDVFAWFAERGGWTQPVDDRRTSFELPPIDILPPSESGHSGQESDEQSAHHAVLHRSASATHLSQPSGLLPITVIPPSNEKGDSESIHTVRHSNEKIEKNEKSDKEENHGTTRKKKAHQIIKEQVNKRQSQIQTTISKKLGRGNTLRSQMSRASSSPDLGLMLGDSSRFYQASSIHARQKWSPRTSYIETASPLPTPPPPPPSGIPDPRTAREKRLIADLWLTSAATFRRMGKLEQARAAIQEAETLDESNPGLWVQLGLYFVANGDPSHAISAFHKALVINPDYIPAIVHLAQQYLTPSIGQPTTSPMAREQGEWRKGAIDLAAGMLSSFTKGPGWDIPEAWYLLAKAVSLQGRKERERECLTYALSLVEGKPIRSVGIALSYAL